MVTVDFSRKRKDTNSGRGVPQKKSSLDEAIKEKPGNADRVAYEESMPSNTTEQSTSSIVASHLMETKDKPKQNKELKPVGIEHPTSGADNAARTGPSQSENKKTPESKKKTKVKKQGHLLQTDEWKAKVKCKREKREENMRVNKLNHPEFKEGAENVRKTWDGIAYMPNPDLLRYAFKTAELVLPAFTEKTSRELTKDFPIQRLFRTVESRHKEMKRTTATEKMSADDETLFHDFGVIRSFYGVCKGMLNSITQTERGPPTKGRKTKLKGPPPDKKDPESKKRDLLKRFRDSVSGCIDRVKDNDPEQKRSDRGDTLLKTCEEFLNSIDLKLTLYVL